MLESVDGTDEGIDEGICNGSQRSGRFATGTQHAGELRKHGKYHTHSRRHLFLFMNGLFIPTSLPFLSTGRQH